MYKLLIFYQLCHLLVKAHYNQTSQAFKKDSLKSRDDIKHAMNTTEVTLGILLDYFQVFDTIDHLTLLEMLHMLNLSVQASKLMHSYVSERKQFVQDLTRKRLWIHFDKNLSCSYNVNNVTQSSYATHRNLCQFNRFTRYKVRKSLAETLILSKIRYCLVVYSQLPKHQIQRLQKAQNRIFSYVLGRYIKENDLIKTSN